MKAIYFEPSLVARGGFRGHYFVATTVSSWGPITLIHNSVTSVAVAFAVQTVSA